MPGTVTILNLSRVGGYKGPAFVSEPDSISEGLVKIIASKACQATITVKDALIGGEDVAYGSGGWLLSLAKQDEAGDTVPQPAAKKAKTDTHVITPITAKHNLESEDDERFVSATMTFVTNERNPALVCFPDGGCVLSTAIQVRPATEDECSVEWSDDDVAYGTTCMDAGQFLSKKPILFEKVSSDFQLRIGQKVAIAVYRTFDISHEDALAPSNTEMEKIYGRKGGVSIYTGTVRRLSENGKTFEHDINTFRGCSGAIIFLLDVQSDDTDQDYYGMAVGVHVGGIPSFDRNLVSKV